MANKPENLKPFKPGQSGNPLGKPKGTRNFKTDFMIACREVAKSLRLGEEPDKVQIELIKRGIAEGLKGNFPFWDRLMKRIYGDEEKGVNVFGDKVIVFQVIKDDGKGT